MEQKEYLKLIEDWKLEHKEEILEGQSKKTFIECLPTRGSTINWLNSIGYEVHIIHGDIETDIKIIDYERNKRKYITLMYNETEYEMHTNVFRKCEFSNILGIIKPKFKYKIGDKIKDDKRDIIIIDREYRKRIRNNGSSENQKYYRYFCNICNYSCGKYYSTRDKEFKNELWIEENVLERGYGCSCCCSSPQIVVKDINSIYKTDPWMTPYIGEDIAKTHTYNSGDKVEVTCPDCGKIKRNKVIISNLYQQHSIGCSCSDRKSYISKYVFNMLEQMNVNFIIETKFDWCNFYNPFKKRNTYGIYDFVLEDEKIIIETDGGFHRQDNTMSGQTKDESKYIDYEKDRLAIENEYKIVRISDERDVKQNILDSDLVKLFNLNDIDWYRCEEFSLTNLVKKACGYWSNGINNTKEIADLMKYNRATVIRWLTKGNEINWCTYNGKEEMKKWGLKSGRRLKEQLVKKVEIFKNDKSLGIFESGKELERQSEKLFGTKLFQSGISKVCTGDLTYYKKYTFKYI